MTYQATIGSSVLLGTTAAVSANLGATLFVTTNMAFKGRMEGFSSIEGVRAHEGITTTSNAYKGLRTGFQQTGAAVPVYLGRRKADSVTLTPRVAANITYSFNVSPFTVADYEDEVEGGYTITASPVGTATPAEVVTALLADIAAQNTNAGIAGITATGTDTIVITPEDGYEIVLTQVTNLDESYVTTENAADLISAIYEENVKDWYFFTCDDHDQAFIMDVAAEIEASESSDYPKQYRTTVADANVLTALTDPAVDTLGLLRAANYNRTHAEWSHLAEDIFPEVGATVYQGQFFPSTTTWKFMSNLTANAARDLVTGKRLSPNKQGYIKARNGSWIGEGRGVDFMHGGQTAGGEWVDVIRGKDWLNDAIETRLLTFFINRTGSKVTFNNDDLRTIEGVINGVLKEAVDRKILRGYIPARVPANITFTDQANRLLRDVAWTGYLAGAIHYVTVSGVLTYQSQEIE